MAQAFTEAIALAKAFDANDGFGHWLDHIELDHIGDRRFHFLKIHQAAD